MNRILILEDDMSFSTMLQVWLQKKGYAVDKCNTVAAAVKKIGGGADYQLVLSDMRLPDRDGICLLEWLRARNSQIPFIVMTSYAEVQNAVMSMKKGATDYIAKPIQPDILLQKITDAMAQAAPPACTTPSAPATASAAPEPAYLEGSSPASRRLYSYVSLVAPTPMTVLIIGASGTGKEYVARRIHELSKRAGGKFLAIDCGAIPKDVAASELFGYVKGAFTGADTDKTGAFVEANGGTLFLDEVGNLSYEVQVQLLRALQERVVRPLGSNKEVKIDFRLVCATNENLQRNVAEGRFREDLLHRINEFTISMPPLSERGEDLMLFANLFVRQANRELDRHVKGFTPAAVGKLMAHSWPGNLRELKNVVRRAALLSVGEHIDEAQLDISPYTGATAAAAMPLHDSAGEMARIEQAIAAAGGNKSKAAQILGIDRKTLYNKLKRLGGGEG